MERPGNEARSAADTQMLSHLINTKIQVDTYILSTSGKHVASFPGPPAQLSVACSTEKRERTASDGKLGGGLGTRLVNMHILAKPVYRAGWSRISPGICA